MHLNALFHQHHAKYWNSAKLVCHSEFQKVLDPFTVKTLPSEDQLHTWKNDINNGRMKHIEPLSGTLAINDINNLLPKTFKQQCNKK